MEDVARRPPAEGVVNSSAAPPPPLAIVAERGTSNNLFQIATLVRAATALEIPVRVFFRGPAALKLRREYVNVDEWAQIYRPIVGDLHERLRAADFETMETFLRDAKQHGDDVQFWVSEETLREFALSVDDLVTYVDGALASETFSREAAHASAVLSF